MRASGVRFDNSPIDTALKLIGFFQT